MNVQALGERFFTEEISHRTGKDTAVTLERVREWFANARPPTMAGDACLEQWHAHSAQCRFAKTLPIGSRVLDVGAGDGDLQVYRAWPAPARPDLEMYAFAMEKGCHFHLYEGHHIGAWPSSPPEFGGMLFDAINARNFIEHIDEPEQFVRWACTRLSPTGSLFLEWPRPEAKFLPSSTELAEFGFRVMTGTYHDDNTHKDKVPDIASIAAEIRKAGLSIEVSGVARTHFLEDELLAYGRKNNDLVSLTLAYWSFTGWCQYLVARKPAISA